MTLQDFQNSIAFGKFTSQRIYSKQHTHKIGEKRHKYGLRHAMLYILWMIISSDYNIKKTSFENFDF